MTVAACCVSLSPIILAWAEYQRSLAKMIRAVARGGGGGGGLVT